MNSCLGIEINHTNIQIVELERTGSGVQLAGASTVQLPRTIDIDTESQDQTVFLSAMIQKAIKDASIHEIKAYVSIPESQVFTRVVKIPKLSKQELLSAIKWEAEQYIPMALEEVNIDYAIVRESLPSDPTNMEIILVAAPKSIIDKYNKIFDDTELELQAIESNTTAIYRMLSYTNDLVPRYVSVHIDWKFSTLTIVEDSIIYTHTLNASMNAFVRLISQFLTMDTSHALEYLKSYGIDKSKFEGKIFVACEQLVHSLTSEIQKAFAYHQQTNTSSQILTIYLTGIGAHIPGLVTYITEILGTETQIVNPWQKITKDKKFGYLDVDSAQYCVPVGLSLHF
jgi:type IV pilus assembly protein PilM